MREIAAILEEHGVMVKMIYTDNPGYLLYEDEHQIVAHPHPETPV